MHPVPAKKNDKLVYLPGRKRFARPGVQLFPLFMLIVVLYFAVMFATQYWRLLQLRETLLKIETEIGAVRTENELMRAEIEKLHSPEYLEQLARQDLGMVRSGELLFLFRNGESGR